MNTREASHYLQTIIIAVWKEAGLDTWVLMYCKALRYDHVCGFLAKEGNGTYIALFPFSFIDSELIMKAFF